MRLAIDAMGGDHAPAAPVHAVIQLAGERPDVHFTIFGDESKIRACATALPGNVEIHHTSCAIDAGEEPVKAVRRKKDSSLVLAAQSVKNGEAQVMVSAGNTGALVTAGLLVIGRLEGIGRPALGPVMPTFNRKGVLLLDAGATMDASSENLLQYAYMGAIYSKEVLGVEEPRIGLLNVGTEEMKGNALAKETFGLLQTSSLNFIGNVEARDMLDGTCDVVVCDGFVGNVVLKLTEGVGLGIVSALKEALLGSLKSKLGALLMKPQLKSFKGRFDYAEYGGAPFLGVAGGCIKAHGGSNTRAWYSTLAQAVRFGERELLQKLTEGLRQQAPVQMEEETE